MTKIKEVTVTLDEKLCDEIQKITDDIHNFIIEALEEKLKRIYQVDMTLKEMELELERRQKSITEIEEKLRKEKKIYYNLELKVKEKQKIIYKCSIMH